MAGETTVDTSYDSYDDRDRWGISSSSPNKSLELNELDPSDRALLETTQDLAKEKIPSFSPEEEGVISFEAQPPVLSNEEKKKLTHAVQEFYGVKELPKENDINFVIRVRELVNKILTLLGKIAEKDHSQVEEMKGQYRLSMQQAAEFTRALGNAGFKIAALAFGVMLGQFIPSFNKADRGVMQFLAQQLPTGAGIYTSDLQARQRAAEALGQLILQEYSAKTSKTQSESGSKQEVLQLLQSTLDSLRRASSAQ